MYPTVMCYINFYIYLIYEDIFTQFAGNIGMNKHVKIVPHFENKNDNQSQLFVNVNMFYILKYWS